MASQATAKSCDDPPCRALTLANPWALCLANGSLRTDTMSSTKDEGKASTSSQSGSSPLRTWRGKLGLVKLFLRKAQPFYYLELTGDFVSLSGK